MSDKELSLSFADLAQVELNIASFVNNHYQEGERGFNVLCDKINEGTKVVK
jgi:hypothetical protein